MRVWTVQARPPSGQRGPRVMLLRDGFSWGALLLPIPWFLLRGQIALAGLTFAATVLAGLLLPPAAQPFALAGLHLFLGLEARNLESRWLELRGYRTEAVLVAQDEDAAVLSLAAFRPDLARAAT